MTMQDPSGQGPGPTDPDDATAPLPGPGAQPPTTPPQEPLPGYPTASFGQPASPAAPTGAGEPTGSGEPPAAPPPGAPPPSGAEPQPPYPGTPQSPYGAQPQPSYGAQPQSPYGAPPYGASPPAGPAMAWAPPENVVVAGPGVAGLIYAGTLARVVAYIIDSILLGIVTSIATAPFAASIAGAFDPRRGGNIAISPIALIITVGASAIYFIGFWSSGWRGTPGMKLLRLQLGDAATGRTLTPEQAVRRWIGFGTFVQLASFVPALGLLANGGLFLWTIVLLISTATSSTKQGLHDRFASTAIVQPYGSGSTAVIVGCLVLIGLAVILSFVSLIFLGSQVSAILSEVGTSVGP